MFRTCLLFLTFMGGFPVPGVLQVCGMEVYTADEVEAVNGTEVRLKCTFKSELPVSQASVAISWNFLSLDQKTTESVFYYQEKAYPPTEGRFKGHVVWSGDVMKQDASISLQDVLFNFNGTYTCQVRNLPDVHGINGEVTLRVVHKVSVSEIGLLAAAIGGSIAVVLLLMGVYMLIKYCKRQKDDDKWKVEQEETNSLQGKHVQASFLQEHELEATEKYPTVLGKV
ncbi:hypothetical protein UPYG_G00120090 [Umbra pygmaea]|uniref:Ig-like domain-containing protein n=1 Tax=Umbra pygmaea TaxID=75934 RepID=A0ABD0X4S2_UMBPY